MNMRARGGGRKQKKRMTMKKTLILFLLALLAAPLWGQRTYGEASTDELRQLANNGDANAQFVLGSRYYGGDRVPQDYKQAVYWWTKAANQGHAEAQCILGPCYYNGEGVAQDYKQAVYWYTKAANQGYASAQYYLGVCYYNGYGVAKDYKQAVYWYTKAANQGVAEAQCALGVCYYNGAGVAKDCRQALNWFKKAKAQENELGGMQQTLLAVYLKLAAECAETQAPAATPQSTSTTSSTGTTSSSTPKPKQVSAAELVTQAKNYRYGLKGVTRNPAKAVELYKQAANMGDAEAQDELGGCYHQGNGVEKDYEQAVYWYTQSANQGYARGQYMLGVCYYYGVGVRKDYKQAVKWFNAAKAKKNELSDYVQSSIETYLVEAEKHINEQEGTPQKNTTMVSTTSSSKYGRWPWYYDGVEYGIHFAYIQRAIHARDAVSGETGYADVFGEEGWSKGFQIGMHFNPMGKKEIIGMNSGFYMEMLFDKWKNAPSGYYDNYYEFNLHVPLEMVLYLPLGWESALHLRAGLGADFSCLATLTDWDDSYMPNQDVDYGEGFINRFNLSLNLGLSLHLDGVMFHATYQKGLLGHPFSAGYRCTLDKLSLGVSFVIDD